MTFGRVVAPLALVFVLASCGGHSMVSEGPASPSPYNGPMKLPMKSDDEAPVANRSGAAGRALECEHPVYDGGGGDYDSGLASAQDSAEAALENSFAEEGRGVSLPSDGYRIERRTDDRVLFSYDVDGRTKISFIAYDSITDFDDNSGWGIESWAQCDPSELPESVTENLNINVWEDTSGRRLPIDTIQSFDGAEHCGWQDITFIRLGPGQTNPEYVRDTSGELAGLLTGKFDRSGQLPERAIDTGFQRNGRQLWLDSDRPLAYLVNVDKLSDVEVWPASKDRINCA